MASAFKTATNTCSTSLQRNCKSELARLKRITAPFKGASTSNASVESRYRCSACYASRRDIASLLPATWLFCNGAAPAAAAAAAAAAQESGAPSPVDLIASQPSNSPQDTSAAPSSVLQQFVDNEYELQFPSNYTYIETPIVRVERGPQPERSPVLARFEAPGGQPGTISILMRRANALKQTLLQVNDISQLGDPIEVAQLLLPRGSTLLATATQQVPVPPKQTPLGPTELPPQTYYRFEFTTPQGDHVAMSAAARRGSVYICGASMTAERWQQAGPVFGKVVKSFRIRAPAAVA